MILWETPVIDRTQTNVTDAIRIYLKGYDNLTPAEKFSFNSGLKGSLNRQDLSRIENNIQLLSDVLELNLTTHYQSIPEFPNITYFDNLKSNISAILNAYTKYDTTPSVPNEPFNTYLDWNDIEQILFDVYTILNSNFHYYTGTGLYSGRRIGLV